MHENSKMNTTRLLNRFHVIHMTNTINFLNKKTSYTHDTSRVIQNVTTQLKKHNLHNQDLKFTNE